MSSLISGKELQQSLLELENKTTSAIAEVRGVLNPKLIAQGIEPSTENTYSSVIGDLAKLKTVEDHPCNGSLMDINFEENKLFSKTLLPSNAVMFSNTRSVFVEEGLLYVLDFDVETLQTTNKKIYKIEPLWNLASESNLKIIKGFDNNIFVYSDFDSYALCLYGDGIDKDGDIKYSFITFGRPLTIKDFRIGGTSLAFITTGNDYYRIDLYEPSKDYDLSNGLFKVNMYFESNCICDGMVDYVGSKYGEVYLLDRITREFNFIIDITGNRDYDAHRFNRNNNPNLYIPILAFCKNFRRISFVTADILYTSYSYYNVDFEKGLSTFTLPIKMSIADFAVNRVDYHARAIVYGLDENLNAIAYSFTRSDEPLEKVILGDEDKFPQYVTFGVIDDAAVMISVYENTVKASDCYSEEDIINNNIKDYKYTTMTMSYAVYENKNYTFYPEFNPLFIPSKVVSNNNATVVIGETGISPLFNIAVTKDQIHWNIVNIPKDIAINVQDIAVNDNLFVMCGYDKDILISNYGYNWESIKVYTTGLIANVSITYNKYHDRFYILSDDMEIVEFNPNDKSLRYHANIDITDVIGEKIMSYREKLLMTAKMNDGTVNTFVSKNDLENPDPMVSTFIIREFSFFNDVEGLYAIHASVIDMIEVGEETYAVYRLDKPYMETPVLKNDKNLIYGVLVRHFTFDKDLSYGGILIDDCLFRVAFAYDPNKPLTITKYLNNIIINHARDDLKVHIGDLKSNTVVCQEIDGSMYGVVITTAKCSSVSSGYIHFLQENINKFTRMSYILSSDKPYIPMVSDLDLDIGKKAYQIKEYNLESVSTGPDKNGDKEHYPVLLSNLEDVSCGPIIYTDRFIKLANSNIAHTSKDGMNWGVIRMPVSGQWTDIAYGNGVYVAVRYINTLYGEVYYSFNLYDWYKANIPAITQGWSEVMFDNGLFVVSATNVAGKYVLESTNGINWTANEFNSNINKIRMCHSNTNTVLYFTMNSISPDGGYYRSDTKTLYTSTNGDGTIITNLIDMTGKTEDDNTNVEFSFLLESNGVVRRYCNGEADDICQIPGNPTTMRMIKDEHGRYILFFYKVGDYHLYMEILNSPDELWRPIKIDLLSPIELDSSHLICYYDDKIIIGTKIPSIINLRDTYSDIIEGTFIVMAGEIHRESLPFTPDHVFLFGAKSYICDSKFLLGEIHSEKIVTVNGSNQSTLTTFNNTNSSIGVRSESENKILTKAFVFKNNTMSDRHINYIAIKEDHYK